MKHSGTVYIVGAGPGNPDLITVRGLTCLREADVVLHEVLRGGFRAEKHDRGVCPDGEQGGTVTTKSTRGTKS